MMRWGICNYKQKFILLHYIKGCVLNRVLWDCMAPSMSKIPLIISESKRKY